MLLQWGFTGYRVRMVGTEFPTSDFLKMGRILGYELIANTIEGELRALSALCGNAVPTSAALDG